MEHLSYRPGPEVPDETVAVDRTEPTNPHQRRLAWIGKLLDSAERSGWLSPEQVTVLEQSLHAVNTEEPARYQVASQVVEARLQRLSNPTIANALRTRQTEISHALSLAQDLLVFVHNVPATQPWHESVRQALRQAGQEILPTLLRELRLNDDDADALTALLEVEYIKRIHEQLRSGSPLFSRKD